MNKVQELSKTKHAEEKKSNAEQKLSQNPSKEDAKKLHKQLDSANQVFDSISLGGATSALD